MNAEYQKVTLEQLLSHHGGFPSRNNPLSLPWSKIYSLKGSPREQRYEYVRRFLEEAPEAKPGTKFIYSNPGYAAAAAMMEQITNTSWETLIRRRLFEPLKMRSAGFGPMGTAGKVDEPWQHRLADPDSLDGKTKHEPIDPTPRNDNPDAIAPAGKVHCSLADWARFIQLHLAGEAGKSKLLKPETIRYLHRPYADNYALGWLATDRDWGGGRVLTHSGSNTQNFCVVWMAPKRQFAVLICTNQGGKAADAACDEAAASLIQHFLLGAPK